MTLAQSNNFSWKEAEFGCVDIPSRDPSTIDRPIWYRRQTSLERGLGNDAGTGDRLITSIQLSPPNPTSHQLNFDVVQAAVRQLRFKHPAIASRQGRFGQSPAPDQAVFAYEVPGSESDIDSWLSKVVFDRSDVISASSGDIEKAIETLTYDLGKPGSPGKPLFMLHYIPAASPGGQHGLVFFFSHAIFDAIGCFQLIDSCVTKIAESLATGGKRNPFSWGEETSRLPPALVESARIPYTADKTPDDELMLQRIRDLLPSLSHAHKIPIPKSHQSPPATGLFTRILSPGVVTSLRTAARARGCTIFGVLWAAMALASVRIHSPEDNTDVTFPQLIAPVDIRSLACDDPSDRSQWKDRLSSGYNAYVAQDLGRFVRSPSGIGSDSQQLSEDLWVLAKEVREQAQEQKKHMERMPVWIDDMVATVTAGIMESLGDELGKPSNWYPLLSSIGVMDKYLARSHPVATGGQLTVSSPRLVPVFYTAFMESLVALHAFTWEGELMMAFTFPEAVMGSAQGQVIASNEGRHGDAIVLQFINEFMNILDVTSKSK